MRSRGYSGSRPASEVPPPPKIPSGFRPTTETEMGNPMSADEAAGMLVDNAGTEAEYALTVGLVSSALNVTRTRIATVTAATWRADPSAWKADLAAQMRQMGYAR